MSDFIDAQPAARGDLHPSMAKSRGAYLAIDWGTTNRRIYLVDTSGNALERLSDDRGVLALAPADYPREIETLRERFGALPILAAGMVGSTRGWREAPYVAAPADLDALARACLTLDGEVTIVPGVALHGPRNDVMRGEEIQVLGAIAAPLAPGDALFCQPGTHNKWVEVREGRIVDLATAMTGELFALLSRQGILAGMLEGEVSPGAAFRNGIQRGAGAIDLLVALFEVRAAVLLGALAPRDAASFASGLLIGADVGARRLVGRQVFLLASGPLAVLYRAAIVLAGGRPCGVDSHAAFLAGMHAIWTARR